MGEACVARGFLLLPTIHDFVSVHDHEAAFAVAAEAGEIGARFADRDLTALAMMEKGHALVRQGRASEGLRLVDETMVAVTTEEPSPVIAGIVYCTTIAFCQAVFELGRAQEWTEAHTAWCERQSDMRAYMGACLVHRAEIMTLAGNWSAAVGDGALGALAGSARAPLGRLRLRLPLQPAHARAAREQPADDRAVGVRELARHAAAGSASDDRVGGRVSAARRSCSLELASATWHRSVRPGDHGLQRRGRPRAGRDASANYRLVRLTPFADTAPFM